MNRILLEEIPLREIKGFKIVWAVGASKGLNRTDWSTSKEFGNIELTGVPLQMTIAFGTLKKCNHSMLIYICAKFHACKQICMIKSLTARTTQHYIQTMVVVNSRAQFWESSYFGHTTNQNCGQKRNTRMYSIQGRQQST